MSELGGGLYNRPLGKAVSVFSNECKGVMNFFYNSLLYIVYLSYIFLLLIFYINIIYFYFIREYIFNFSCRDIRL